ncbi:inositol monophosphatase [Leptospira sp. 201903075]|uniref:inositol monophosphatase family protein n=1 Tax=Leptospira chreensis TaxID=2810035 RepID=UPI0019655E03|nr:inositol monophosphatase family protein [Leptospira chreensis]MBM9591637.1 inositol monophosphatase [Leptospira chreensis]
MQSELLDRSYHFLKFLPTVADFLVQKHKESGLKVDEKGLYNLVTEADLKAESMILDEIQKNYPTDGILSEERGKIEGKSGYTWVVDPLDGTTNYTHGLPLYGISVGVVETETMTPLIGMVFFPELNTYYHAIKGQGAFREKTPIQVSKTPSLKDSLFVTGFPYDRNLSLDTLMQYYKSILQKSRGIRRTGAATLDLCWLAEGKFEGYYELGLKPWDMAAAGLVVLEAKGKITSMDGNDFSIMNPSLLATNGLVHEYLLAEFEGQINRVAY